MTYVMSNAVSGIISILIFLAIILFIREIVCWYWKMNKVVELLDENNELLNTLVNHVTKGKKTRSRGEKSNEGR